MIVANKPLSHHERDTKMKTNGISTVKPWKLCCKVRMLTNTTRGMSSNPPEESSRASTMSIT